MNNTIDTTDTTIAEAIGPELTMIATAARLISRDADACLHEQKSAFELAVALEEARERSIIARDLIESALGRIDERHATASWTLGPMERAQEAMRVGGAA